MMRVWLLLLGLVGLMPARGQAQDQVTFGLDWKAEAEYGGYYQAVATGIYARHGLAVTIRQGGPQVNQAQLLLAGRLDFDIASNSFLALNFAQQHLPFVVVAAMFQKDPTVLLAHAGQGNDTLSALQGKPIMISGDSRAGWWNFLRARFAYTDRQIRPYTFNLQPFLANPAAIQQGYVTSEPFSIHATTGQWPVVLLLADAGFSSYGSLIATSRKLIAAKPDVVQRFVDASIEGWYSYLYGDPGKANALIKEANPDMTDALLEYGRTTLLKRGIVDSGDAAQYGIGTMSATRWANFTGLMVQQKLYPRGTDPSAAYTLQFVNQRVGLPK
jgi:NitT/TauT family transport system substrate-binding protein